MRPSKISGMFKVETSSLLFMDRERQEAEATAPEAALVASVRAGDREAFARLYALYAPLVHAVLQVCKSPLVSAAAVEEGGIRIELERLRGQPEKGFVHVTA